jgi:anti-sigma regulatory factor (Ser/Thr protein kinase)
MHRLIALLHLLSGRSIVGVSISGPKGFARPNTITESDHMMTIDSLPPAARQTSREFPGTPDQVAAVRRMLRHELCPTHPGLHDAQLLGTETATNALQHTKTGDGGCFTFTLWHTPVWLRVAVRDDGADTIPCVSPAGTLTGNGRGIRLIEHLATRWGFTRHNGRTEVWFELGSHLQPATR